jgi:hypothetical protein
MQFSSVAMQDQPFFAQKAIDPVESGQKQGRAALTAGLLQRVATEVSIVAAAQHRRGVMPHPLGQWIAPNRLHDEPRRHDEPSIAALLRAASQPHDSIARDRTAMAPAGRRRPRLSNKLQKLARTLSDDDLALAVGQMSVLVKARRRAA